MKLTCPECNSEDLDQGVSGKILCHGCKKILMLIEIRIDSGI
jgi:transcription initiation factor TFIIIB Brf1 subunit/transcription initiation factor TFIIB